MLEKKIKIFKNDNSSFCIDAKAIIPFLKSISDWNRLKILCFLKDWEQCVCDIVDFLWAKQNLVSHHLKQLKDLKILNSKKKWLKVYYSINKEIVCDYVENFNKLFNNSNNKK